MDPVSARGSELRLKVENKIYQVRATRVEDPALVIEIQKSEGAAGPPGETAGGEGTKLVFPGLNLAEVSQHRSCIPKIVKRMRVTTRGALKARLAEPGSREGRAVHPSTFYAVSIAHLVQTEE